MKRLAKIAAMALMAALWAGDAAGQGLLGNRMGLNRSRGLLNRGGANGRAGGGANAAAANAAGGEAVDLTKLPEKGTNGVPTRLAFEQAPVDMLLYAYADVAGKILLPTPDLPKTQITLKTLDDRQLTKEEYLQAIEVTLTMHGVVIEPFDKIFMRAFARKSVRTQGIRTSMEMPKDGALAEKGKVISQLIRLTHITADEAQKAIEGFKSGDAAIQVFERTNTMLVTDTQENVNRMLEVIRELDVANPVLEDVFVRQIQYAVANEIKTALETIVTESQKETQQAQTGPKTSGAPGFGSGRGNQPHRPGSLLNRLRQAEQQQQPAATPNAVLMASVSDADRGMIRGKVLILADDRSNKLIVITTKANMNFFDKVIETLDVETTPEVSVEVIRLKYADSEEVASMLNDLIGNNSSGSQQKNNQNQNTQRGTQGNRNLTNNTRQRQTTANPTFGKNANSNSLGELNKDNIKILADKRINGIVVMARKADMKAVKEVIEDMDVKLSQVLIETVILQVELGDDLVTGVDWVQRGKYNKVSQVQEKDTYGRPLYWMRDDETGRMIQTHEKSGDDAVPVMKTVSETVRDGFFNHGGANAGYMLGGGGGSSSGTLGKLMDAAVAGATNDTTIAAANPIAGGINYFLKSDKLNIAAVIQASKTDSRTKVLASPILMTVDNKEATIEATDMIYLFSGYQYSGSTYSGSQVRNYEKRDIGLTVKVTPRINPNGTVVLEVEQTFETQGADQAVPNESGGTDPYATVTTRKISSEVSVENRQTVVMGGLTKKTNVNSESGIPILKDIPWIGKWLFGQTSTKEARSELLVFMTPYVLDDAEAAQAEALRRKKTLSDPRAWDDGGWSTSPLADPVSKKELLRRFTDEWNRQDEERRTKLAIEKAKVERAKKLKKMTEEERKFWLELHKEDLEDEERKEFEKKVEEQKDLRELVEQIKSEKIEKAEEELKSAEEQVKSEKEAEKFDSKSRPIEKAPENPSAAQQ